jgi:hypothetical protein
MATSDTVAETDLTVLATRRVLIGHQSVGANLLDGIELLAQIPQLEMKLGLEGVPAGGEVSWWRAAELEKRV